MKTIGQTLPSIASASVDPPNRSCPRWISANASVASMTQMRSVPR